MTVEVAIVMLWCVGRMRGAGRARNELVLGLFERIKDVVGVGREDPPELVLTNSHRHN
jgi:hypothetical protein